MKQTLAIVAAGIAAFITAAALQHFTAHPAYEIHTAPASMGIRALTAVVFFGILMIFGRRAFTTGEPEPPPVIHADTFEPKATPQETSDAMAGAFFGVTDEASRRRAIRNALYAVPQVTVLIPFIFYLRFGIIGPLGWGLTVFFDVYCLLAALGLYFRPRTEYHSPVKLRGDWLDRVGAFWLVGCAFGPLFGWAVTEVFPITPGSWRWLYGLRVFLAAGIPILLSLPLLRYVRGKAATVSLPLLLAVTLLPVTTAVQVGRDLWEGPGLSQGSKLYLKHTERELGNLP